LVSCTKDNNDVIHVELEGSWSLTNAICYCAFDSNTDFGVHKIVFEGSQLTSINTGQPEFLVNSSGGYTVEGNLITLSNNSQFRYVIENNTLTLTFVDKPEIADDELSLVYIKN